MPDAIDLILRAAAYAATAHAGQRRKNLDVPYINHPLRVALAARRCGLSDAAVAAAMLHDVVEDTAISHEDIEAAFPPRVATLVRLLTKWWPDDAPTELKSREKPKYYGAVLGDEEAVNLKLLDRADNLSDMALMLPRAQGWARRYLKKTDKEFAPLLATCHNPLVRDIYREAAESLRLGLRRLEESSR